MSGILDARDERRETRDERLDTRYWIFVTPGLTRGGFSTLISRLSFLASRLSFLEFQPF